MELKEHCLEEHWQDASATPIIALEKILQTTLIHTHRIASLLIPSIQNHVDFITGGGGGAEDSVEGEEFARSGRRDGSGKGFVVGVVCGVGDIADLVVC